MKTRGEDPEGAEQRMAEEPRKSGPPGIDRDLAMLFAGLEALCELASDEEKAQDGSRVYDFSIRWGVLISGRLVRLEHYHRSGELTGEQRRRYRELRRGLGEAIPQMDRLGVGRPAVPPEDFRRDPRRPGTGGGAGG